MNDDKKNKKKEFEKISSELSSIVNEKEAKEMESDGGIDLEELKKIFSWGDLKLRTQVVERFFIFILCIIIYFV